MMRRLLGAVQFLTVVPVPVRTAEPWRAALFFPLVGAGLGWLGAVLLQVFQPVLPAPVCALLVLVFWTAITGALHEDGLADVADAFRAGRSREKILEILKDSRVGVFGALAVLFSVLLRWQAIIAIPVAVVPALVASQAAPRAVLVVLARVSRPAGSGLGAAFCSSMSTPVTLVAAAQGIAAALLCGPKAAASIVAGSAAIVLIARWYFHRRVGGVTGDCLGATSQTVETFVLVLLACQSCTW
jgi:adenosylcobinamide-GDP ribazoletransferase